MDEQSLQAMRQALKPGEDLAVIQLNNGDIRGIAIPRGSSEQQVLTFAENYFGPGLTKRQTFGPESQKESIAGASQEMGVGKSAIAGVGTTLMDWRNRIRQLLGRDLTAQDTQQTLMARQAPGAVQAGRIAADIAPAIATAPASLPGTMAAGAVQRFISDPVLPGESGAQNALKGAIGSGLGYVGAKVLQGIVRPITPSADVQTLADEGVIPSIGQSARATGTWGGNLVGRVEDAATSYFGIGQSIGHARQRAQQELQTAALRRATPTGMQVTDRIGREGLDETYTAISNRYNEALNNIGVVRELPGFRQELARRVNQAVIGLPGEKANEARTIIQDIITNREGGLQTGYPARIAQLVDEDLGQRIRDFAKGGTASDRLMGNALREAQMVWRDLIRRNAPDDATRAMLDDARRAFANYIRVERASNAAGAPGGEFTAAQLSNSVRATSGGGARHAQYARGDALMQDLSDAGRSVLTGGLGESGTTPRALLGMLAAPALGGAAYANQQANYPGSSFLTGLLALGAASPLLYSRAASRYAIGDLLPGFQNPTATFLGAASPYAGALGRILYERQDQ